MFRITSQWEMWFSQLIGKLARQADRSISDALASELRYDPATDRFAPDSPVAMASSEDMAALLSRYLPGTDVCLLQRQLDTAADDMPLTPAAPLIPLLSTLRQTGLKIGLSTNDSEAAARAHLDRFNLLGMFDFVAGYDSGFGAKPGSGMQRAFAEQMALAPDRIAMVGDSVYDLTAGRAIGMVTIGVLSGPSTEDILSPMADVVLPDISHLPHWLSDHP
ncbi:phosphoglycolate phosphatase [Rubricella aquisinus]|uniref:phosphoglycolate phosphatase n=1 Tax=Rubricella aquisinus TaxID=2028108 RepID=A0A840WKF6_9RHOB|nr:phosphoglycolate phosphatase [Rubricella aquisinus]